MSADRVVIARAFGTASLTGAGMALGMWAGRGDWEALSQQSRDDAGRRALGDVDLLIYNLRTFRQQLAAAVEPPVRETYWNDRVHAVEPLRGSEPLHWFFGLCKAASNPQMWCDDCYGVVELLGDRLVCGACRASQSREDAALRLAQARQEIARQANTGLPVPGWGELTPGEQDQAETEARHWIRAAVDADLWPAAVANAGDGRPS